jgi:polyhydroxyalkanoate synthesis repressor PhaR
MTTARTIKRYANRKLYDTRDSRYVTLDHIAAMVRAGDDVRVVENTTRADLTTATLAQIIFEEEKKQRSFLPLAAMRNIIQSGGEWFAEAQRRVQSILPGKRGKDGELIVEDPPAPVVEADDPGDEAAQKKKSLAALREWVDHSKHRLEDWQKQVDAKVRGTIETVQHTINPLSAVNKDVKALTERIAELETKLRELETHEDNK